MNALKSWTLLIFVPTFKCPDSVKIIPTSDRIIGIYFPNLSDYFTKQMDCPDTMRSRNLGSRRHKKTRMMKMARKRKTLCGVFHIRLTELTCKIVKTETNANRPDLLAPKKKKKIPGAFQTSSLLQWWGAQSGVNIQPVLRMAQCVGAKQGAVKWRLGTLQAACRHWADPRPLTKLTTTMTVLCSAVLG